MPIAWIVEIVADESKVARGVFDFLALPAPGERVTVANGKGTRDVMGVVLVEHVPVPAAKAGDAPAARQPAATVYVQWIAEDDGTAQRFV